MALTQAACRHEPHRTGRGGRKYLSLKKSRSTNERKSRARTHTHSHTIGEGGKLDERVSGRIFKLRAAAR